MCRWYTPREYILEVSVDSTRQNYPVGISLWCFPQTWVISRCVLFCQLMRCWVIDSLSLWPLMASHHAHPAASRRIHLALALFIDDIHISITAIQSLSLSWSGILVSLVWQSLLLVLFAYSTLNWRPLWDAREKLGMVRGHGSLSLVRMQFTISTCPSASTKNALLSKLSVSVCIKDAVIVSHGRLCIIFSSHFVIFYFSFSDWSVSHPVGVDNLFSESTSSNPLELWASWRMHCMMLRACVT